MKYVVPKELLPLLRSKVTRKEVEEMIGSGRYLPIASASTLGAIRVGNSLTIDSDGVLSVVGSGISVEWGNISDKPTTLSGYGITDAGISGNTITLGNTSITPLVSFTETDPTVPSWAKQANKPSYAYSEISGTPTNVSAFTNDAGYLTEHQSLDALTPKVQAIPYIVGPNTDETAGTWTGTYEGITALTEGLTIVYVPHVAGDTTTTLNINGLGAKTCYYSGTSKLTTHYPVGTPILFTYYNNGWRRADYNSNTTYSAGTKALFDAGTNTSNRVWSAKILADSVAPIEHEHNWSDINNAPAFITADALNGYATETYVDTEISDLNLGTASQKDFTTSVTQGGADLPTSDAVYSAISSAVTSALHYRGMSSTAITDGGTETATIGGQPLTAQSGDIVIYNGLEFLWEEGHWNKLGDDSSYALKTVTVTGADGITGGGDLTANMTLGLSSTTQTNINKGVTAYGWGDHSQAGYLTSFTETDPTVPSWAKASTKPSYDYDEIENTPFIPTNVSDLTNDAGYISTETDPVFSASVAHGITSSDISSWNGKYTKPSGGIPKADLASAVQTSLGKADTALQSFTETDPTVPNWAKQTNKPTYTASEVGALPDTTFIPTKTSDLNNDSGFITSADIPENVSELTNDAGYITSADVPTSLAELSEDSAHRLVTDAEKTTWNSKQNAISDLADIRSGAALGATALQSETDPIFSESPSAGITSADIDSWNAKQAAISDLSTIRTRSNEGHTAYGWGNHAEAGYLTSFTETDPIFSASPAHGITTTNITNWNTAFSWGNHASEGYLKSVSFADLTSHPTTLSGYGITDAKIQNGVITLGNNTITPLTSFTETDPVFASSASSGITSTDINNWNAKQDAISDLSTIRTNASNGNTAYSWGDHSQAGYLTSYTEIDPVFSASAASGITSSNISTWNGKYAKPSAGIPKTDLANAVQTSLGLADTALQSVPLATDSTIGGFKTGNVNQTYLYFDNDILKVSDSAIADYLLGEGYFDLPTWQDIQNTPTTLSGYGITDAKIANGTITLGSNSITPLTSYTETDPVFSASDAAGITAVDVSNWDEAYGWGNHASAGYALASAIPTSINDLELILDGSTEAKYIYGHGSSGDDYVVFGISNLGNIVIGSSAFQSDEYKSYIYAYEHNIYWGSGTNKRLYFTAAGVIRPTTNNIISLGTSSYKYKELYATNIYGNLNWSYIDDTPTTLSGYGITDAQKAITVSSSEPTSSQGSDGDIWLVI